MKHGESRDSTEFAVSSLLHEGLRSLGIRPREAQIGQLTRLTLLLSKWADRINLTGHREPLELASHLILDAAALSMTLPELTSVETLSDLGSGVGFPGIPIAILHPTLRVNLVESRRKRHHLQKQIRRVLGLDNILPILGRSDQVAAIPSDVVVAQAMTEPRQALQLMEAWCRPGGIIVLPAADTASAPDPPARFHAPDCRTYRIPETGRVRRLWVLRSRTR